MMYLTHFGPVGIYILRVPAASMGARLPKHKKLNVISVKLLNLAV